MQAIRNFWAKSVLNKAVIVSLVGVFCCCPLGLAAIGGSGGTATTAPTATAEQAAAVEPAATAGPTETPALTETPIPAATVILSTETPVIQTTAIADPCSLQVEQAGRSEPKYVGLKGFLKASSYPEGYDQSLPKYPWSVSILRQVGPNLWEPSDDTLPAKTPVRVVEQHLTHQRYGVYNGHLIVQSLEDLQNYVVDHHSFVPTDYWNCPPHIAAKYGPFIARVKDGVKPVDRNGRWVDVGELREVYCVDVPDIKSDNLIEDGVECFMYKDHSRGYGGVKLVFPSEGLGIIY